MMDLTKLIINSKLPETPGIYMIINVVDKKVYIGQSLNVKKRIKRHFYELSKEIHPNAHLQRSFNIYGKDQSIKDQVEKLVKGRKVDSTTAINAINELIAGKTGSVAGGYSREAASFSITGAISNFKDAFSNSLLRIDWENSPGLMSFKKFLLNVSDAFGTQEFGEIIRNLAESLFGPFEQITKKDILAWFHKLAQGIESLTPIISSLWDALNKFITGEESLFSSMIHGAMEAGTVIARIIKAAIWDAAAPEWLTNKMGGSQMEQLIQEFKYKEEVKQQEISLKKAKERQAKKDYADEPFKQASEAAKAREKAPVTNNTYNIKVVTDDPKTAGDSVEAKVRTAGLAAGKLDKKS